VGHRNEVPPGYEIERLKIGPLHLVEIYNEALVPVVLPDNRDRSGIGAYGRLQSGVIWSEIFLVMRAVAFLPSRDAGLGVPCSRYLPLFY